MQEKQPDLIAEYEHWNVYLDIKQYYLGRVFIMAKRLEAEGLLKTNEKEWIELKDILQDINEMYQKTFKPDLQNHDFFGNDLKHCHCHVVPRYDSHREIEVNGEVFQDEFPGQNYSQGEKSRKAISPETFEEIKLRLKNAIYQVRESKVNIKKLSYM